jgi:hypothetical protein
MTYNRPVFVQFIYVMVFLFLSVKISGLALMFTIHCNQIESSHDKVVRNQQGQWEVFKLEKMRRLLSVKIFFC